MNTTEGQVRGVEDGSKEPHKVRWERTERQLEKTGRGGRQRRASGILPDGFSEEDQQRDRETVLPTQKGSREALCRRQELPEGSCWGDKWIRVQEAVWPLCQHVAPSRSRALFTTHHSLAGCCPVNPWGTLGVRCNREGQPCSGAAHGMQGGGVGRPQPRVRNTWVRCRHRQVLAA